MKSLSISRMERLFHVMAVASDSAGLMQMPVFSSHAGLKKAHVYLGKRAIHCHKP